MDKIFRCKDITFDSEKEFKKLGNLGFGVVLKEEICPDDIGSDSIEFKFTTTIYKFTKTHSGVYTGTIKDKNCEAYTIFKLKNGRYESTNLVGLFFN